MHGGNTPTGLASPSWKNGTRSKYLPIGLAAEFRESLSDPLLMQIRQDVALVEAILVNYTRRIKDRPGKPLTKTQRAEIVMLTEQRRKLIESDARRQRDLGQLVEAAKFMTLVAAVAELIREFVPQADLPKAQTRLRHLLIGQAQQQPAIDVEARS